MGEELYFALIENLEEESTPLELVQNLEEKKGVRGPNGWKAIVNEAVGMNGPRLSGLAKQVFSPEKVKKYEDVIQALENGQGLLRNTKMQRRARCQTSER